MKEYNPNARWQQIEDQQEKTAEEQKTT